MTNSFFKLPVNWFIINSRILHIIMNQMYIVITDNSGIRSLKEDLQSRGPESLKVHLQGNIFRNCTYTKLFRENLILKMLL